MLSLVLGVGFDGTEHAYYALRNILSTSLHTDDKADYGRSFEI